MPKVKKQTAGTIGLVAAILFIIGNVVGIGIFFKNGTVFRLNDNNAIGVLVSWGLSIVIVLCMALSFAEVSTCKMKNKNAGVGGWAAEFYGHSFGRYAKTGYSLIFWPANTFAIMFFTGEAILECFAPINGWSQVFTGYDFGTGTTAMVFVIGAALFAVFILLNYFKGKAMGKAGSIISFVKFAPILMVVVLGIVFGAIPALGGHGGLWSQIGKEGNEMSIFGSMAAIPAILFSFEGYISVGNISGDIKDPEKNLSLAVVLGVIIISVLYLAVTIGCITAGTGNVYILMNTISNNETVHQVLTVLISIFIFICLIGCMNGMAKGGMSAFASLAEEKALFGSKALLAKKPENSMFAGFVLFGAVSMLWWVILVIPSSILNTDAMADGSSTSMIVCLYLIYGVTVLGGLVNRKTKKVQVRKQKAFPVTAIIGVLGCVFMVVFVAFIQFLAAPIANGFSNLDGRATEGSSALWQLKSGWGMFVNAPNCLGIVRGGTKGYVLTNAEALIWFWVMTAIAALLPFINDLLIKWTGNKEGQQLIWEKKAPKGAKLNAEAL